MREKSRFGHVTGDPDTCLCHKKIFVLIGLAVLETAIFSQLFSSFATVRSQK